MHAGTTDPHTSGWQVPQILLNTMEASPIADNGNVHDTKFSSPSTLKYLRCSISGAGQDGGQGQGQEDSHQACSAQEASCACNIYDDAKPRPSQMATSMIYGRTSNVHQGVDVGQRLGACSTCTTITFL